MTNNSTLLSSI